ncbi:MAG: hypothetical protein ACI9FJ_003246 [Alteromonadaceae bacterium]|jgi:hypothetical protein
MKNTRLKNTKKYQGSCLCGEISYQVDEFKPHLGHCHCHMCQKFHGAAFSTFAEVELKHLHWLSGEQNLKSYRAENNTLRQFCQTCGSSLLFSSKYNVAAGTIELAIATLDQTDDQPELKPDAHIYTDSKVPWLSIDDDLPKHKAYRDSD